MKTENDGADFQNIEFGNQTLALVLPSTWLRRQLSRFVFNRLEVLKEVYS